MYLTEKINPFPKPKPPLNKDGTIKKTCTSMFLAPCVLNTIVRKDAENLYNPEYGFINAYLQDHTHEILHDNHIYFLFNPPKFTVNFRNYIEKIKQTELYEEDYDIAPEYLGKVMIVMKFKEKYNNVKENVLKGKYSDIDPEYMQKYIQVSDFNGMLTLPYKIYTKHPSLKQALEERLNATLSPTAELWSIPEINEEIYNYNPDIKYKI